MEQSQPGAPLGCIGAQARDSNASRMILNPRFLDRNIWSKFSNLASSGSFPWASFLPRNASTSSPNFKNYSVGQHASTLNLNRDESLTRQPVEIDSDATSPGLLVCNLCRYQGKSKSDVINHMISAHRAELLSTMQKIQNESSLLSSSSIAISPSSLEGSHKKRNYSEMADCQNAAISSLASSPYQSMLSRRSSVCSLTSEGLEMGSDYQAMGEFPAFDHRRFEQLSGWVKKILDDGPEAWVSQYCLDRGQTSCSFDSENIFKDVNAVLGKSRSPSASRKAITPNGKLNNKDDFESEAGVFRTPKRAAVSDVSSSDSMDTKALLCRISDILEHFDSPPQKTPTRSHSAFRVVRRPTPRYPLTSKE